MDDLTKDEAKNMSGWLEKKSSKTFGGYQKRYFKIMNGEYITYAEKEADITNSKVRITIDSIDSVEKKEDKKFRFQLKNEDRIYHLKAKSKDVRDKWVASIELLKTLLKTQEQSNRSASVMVGNAVVNRLSQKNVTKTKKKGDKTNKNIKLNEKLLDKRGINNLLSLSNPDIKKRFFSGFLKRETKGMELKKKKILGIII